MPGKSDPSQIRITTDKSDQRPCAEAVGLDASEESLAPAPAARQTEFATLLRELEQAGADRFAFAELNDFLTALTPAEFSLAVANATLDRASALVQNLVAAMVEQAAMQKNVAAPPWTSGVEPLAEPWFATPLANLRVYLLRVSPAAYKRRNLFVDAGMGDRV